MKGLNLTTLIYMCVCNNTIVFWSDRMPKLYFVRPWSSETDKNIWIEILSHCRFQMCVWNKMPESESMYLNVISELFSQADFVLSVLCPPLTPSVSLAPHTASSSIQTICFIVAVPIHANNCYFQNSWPSICSSSELAHNRFQLLSHIDFSSE